VERAGHRCARVPADIGLELARLTPIGAYPLLDYLVATSEAVEAGVGRLAMSGRTLHRRLAAEGVSYQQLLNGARKEAAARYLSDPTLAICEVAYLIGYLEPAPFHRAFKRWYGMTPEIFRERHRRGVG
jgi:AraC-like DNA-binding protein